ncbi:hypothetical protein [Vreelandella aquamarina]|uniref:hypothetical protein n=1 Tax=Vreelandella aquamarina TaxID=77097 RepID=UPI00384D901F
MAIDAVYSSQWCRALETAELMALGAVVPAPWLNSFFRGRGDQVAITQAARERIAGWQGPGNMLLVTHQVNITALTGGGVSSGEMVVVRPQEDGFTVVGRLSVRRVIAQHPASRADIGDLVTRRPPPGFPDAGADTKY